MSMTNIKTVYCWDVKGRHDPCGCRLCKKIQNVVYKRSINKRMRDYYVQQEDGSQVAMVEISISEKDTKNTA